MLGGGWRREDSFPAEAGKGSYRPPFKPPGGRPDTCVPGAGGSGSRLVRGRGVGLCGGAGDEGGGWRPEDAFRSEADRGAKISIAIG